MQPGTGVTRVMEEGQGVHGVGHRRGGLRRRLRDRCESSLRRPYMVAGRTPASTQMKLADGNFENAVVDY